MFFSPILTSVDGIPCSIFNVLVDLVWRMKTQVLFTTEKFQLEFCNVLERSNTVCFKKWCATKNQKNNESQKKKKMNTREFSIGCWRLKVHKGTLVINNLSVVISEISISFSSTERARISWPSCIRKWWPSPISSPNPSQNPNYSNSFTVNRIQNLTWNVDLLWKQGSINR